MTLSEALAERQSLEMALYESGGELTPEIMERMDLNQDTITGKIDGYHSIMGAMEFGTAEIDAEIKRLQALKKTKSNSVKRMKEYLLFKMQEWGLQSIEGTTCKVFRKAATESTKIEDETALLGAYAFKLEEFMKDLPSWVKVDISVAKDELKKSIKETGVYPAGVTLEKGECVQFK